MERFARTCHADERVVAAFISGSHASGTADVHSDIDLGLITSDATYNDFQAGRTAFISCLGEAIFLENFDNDDTEFFVLSDGTEGELSVGSTSHFGHVARGPYQVLLDKTGILAGATFHGKQPAPDAQREALRRLIMWFWHELSHFVTAVARDQVYWAYGQLEALRRGCLSLARLQHDFDDADGATDPYFKVEQILGGEQLSASASTTCRMDTLSMLHAAASIARIYQGLATFLAQTHGLVYPLALERLMLARLESLSSSAYTTSSSSDQL